MKNRATLQEVAEMVRTGNLSSIPDTLELSFQNTSLNDIQLLLDLLRHRSDGHRIDKFDELNRGSVPETNEQLISDVRSLLNQGQFQTALEKIPPHLIDTDPEFGLEAGRANVFLGKFADAVTVLSKHLHNSQLIPTSRGVINQLLGHANLELGQFRKAVDHLEAALEMSRIVGNQSGLFSTYCFLSKIYAFHQDKAKFNQYMGQLQDLVKKYPSQRWLVGYYRTQSHAQFLMKNPKCVIYNLIAFALAKELQDEVCQSRSLAELSLMQEAFGFEILPKVEILTYIKNSPVFANTDLNTWVSMIENRSTEIENQSWTLQIFSQITGLQALKDQVTKVNWDQIINCRWLYDYEMEQFIDFESFLTTEIGSDSPNIRVLKTLNENLAGIPVGQLFEQVWNIKWCEERHLNLVKVTFNRVSKISSATRVSVRAKVATVGKPGLILD